MNRHTRCVLEHLQAAQTIIALYESPTGPTSPVMAFELLAEVLNARSLLEAQVALGAHKIVIATGGTLLIGERSEGCRGA